MKIRKLIYSVLFWLAILSLLGSTFMFLMLNSNRDNGRVVNYSGIVRGGSQRVAKLHLMNQSVDEPIKDLEKIMNGLIDGDESLDLPAAKDSAFREKMENVRTYWNDELKQEMVHEEGQHDLEQLYEKSEEFFQMTSDAVDAAEAYSVQGIKEMKLVAVITFLVNLICIVIIGMIIHRKVLSPLRSLEKGVAKVAEGDLSAEIDYHSKDELGSLADSMRSMIGNLHQYIKEIQYQLKELSEGNLDLQVDAGFQGDFVALEQSLNRIISSLNDTMQGIGMSADQVAMSSSQVADNVQSLAAEPLKKPSPWNG